MSHTTIPENLQSLHRQEETLRGRALEIVAQDKRLQLHLCVIEQAMNLSDLLRQDPTEDENLKVIQVLGMRTFNAFGASLKLALSGYGQNSALIMRDILETVFLLDLFNSDRALIERWRLADNNLRRKEFSPAAVRKTLDERDGFEGRKREEVYRMFSELAAHPTMKSDLMMRPRQNGDAVSGPFIESSSLEAVLWEMGRLAIQVGNTLVDFFPQARTDLHQIRAAYASTRIRWFNTFYPNQPG